MRYRDANGYEWADVIDILTMHAVVRCKDVSIGGRSGVV